MVEIPNVMPLKIADLSFSQEVSVSNSFIVRFGTFVYFHFFLWLELGQFLGTASLPHITSALLCRENSVTMELFMPRDTVYW